MGGDVLLGLRMLQRKARFHQKKLNDFGWNVSPTIAFDIPAKTPTISKIDKKVALRMETTVAIPNPVH